MRNFIRSLKQDLFTTFGDWRLIMPGKRAKQSNRKVIKKIGNGASKNPKKAQKLRTGVKKKNMGKGGY